MPSILRFPVFPRMWLFCQLASCHLHSARSSCLKTEILGRWPNRTSGQRVVARAGWSREP